MRGFIKIEETDEKGLLFHHKEYIFHLLQKPRDWHGLAPHELVMLVNIFPGDTTETRLSSLRNRFYTAVPVVRADIMSALKQKGIYRLDPESANGYSAGAAFCILLPFAIFQYMHWADFFSSVPVLIICLVISAVIWWLFAREMTAKTLKGSRIHTAVLGFQEFMNRVDAERLKVMPPDTFEKFLPYAMALGVEHHWAQGLHWHHKRSAELVHRTGLRLRYGIQSHLLLVIDARHGDRYAPGIRIVTPRQFYGIGMGRRWWRLRRRWRILRRRIRRRRRQRLLARR